ncbi:YggS family pyridoxal phosphate-dependent enzyme [Anoxybacillus flavithermus]|uniref:Pyridoxal phosphate homeostasis protein n=1 Tax=Anoxybacillus flavithermus AK1 TaxID=1297581 RepID=M8CZU0_9BACL|nr:YggS family pyridoxal phosphate-dependent enzyme [Anoxybacillus flavithermus]EMT46978.1 enzyme with a TIM-barrel fold protein [Anoxybacillus flavithermus AK1]
MSVKQRLQTIQYDIAEACEKTGRSVSDVQIVAVTKYVSVARAKEAVEAGIVHLGESRADGFLHKYEAIGKQATWHFIGTLQSRKVKQVIDYVDYIHSLDRLSLAEEIDKRANRTIKCFVQVNVSGEQSKHGLATEDVLPFIETLSAFSRIQVVGLMTMAPYTDDEATIRRCFRTLRELKERVQEKQWSHAPCTELSMGMSNDYVIAVEEGATFIRLGTSLVGEEEVE